MFLNCDLSTTSIMSSMEYREIPPIIASAKQIKKTKVTNLPILFLPTQLFIQVQW
jgi:hypothetical protein